MHQLGSKQKKSVTNVLNGTVSKRYKERLKIQKHETSTYCGNENEEELIETCNENILRLFFFI